MKKIIIFCLRKCDVDNLEGKMLNDWEFQHEFNQEAWGIHGDKLQHERDQVYKRFKTPTKDFTINKGGKKVNACNILIATGVASRGLDVKDIEVVINYDMPMELEEYVHRIGRTGRANAKGIAYSFFDPKKDSGLAKDLCNLLSKSGSTVPQELENLKWSAAGKKGAGKNRWNPRPEHKSKLGNSWSSGPAKSQSISFDNGPSKNPNSGYNFGGA